MGSRFTRSSCWIPRRIRSSRNATVRMREAGARWADRPPYICAGLHLIGTGGWLRAREFTVTKDGAWALSNRRRHQPPARLQDGMLRAEPNEPFAPTATARRRDMSPETAQIEWALRGPQLTTLTARQCLELLRGAVVGRICYVADGRAIIIPVNFGCWTVTSSSVRQRGASSAG